MTCSCSHAIALRYLSNVRHHPRCSKEQLTTTTMNDTPLNFLRIIKGRGGKIDAAPNGHYLTADEVELVARDLAADTASAIKDLRRAPPMQPCAEYDRGYWAGLEDALDAVLRLVADAGMTVPPIYVSKEDTRPIESFSSPTFNH